MDPAADFLLWNHPMDVWEGAKAVYLGKEPQARRLWVAKPILLLVEVEFHRSIGHVGTYCD